MQKEKRTKKFLNSVDITFFLFLCFYISIDPYQNGINQSNITAFLPTIAVLLLMIAKNLKENEVIDLENKLKEKEEEINKLKK